MNSKRWLCHILNTLPKTNIAPEPCFFCCIGVIDFSSAYALPTSYVLPTPLQCPPTPGSRVLICLQHVNHRLRQMVSKKRRNFTHPKNQKHSIWTWNPGWLGNYFHFRAKGLFSMALAVSFRENSSRFFPPSHSTSSRWLFQDLGELLIVAGLAKLHLKIRKANDPKKHLPLTSKH